MVILGLLLILLGVIAVLLAYFTAGAGTLELISLDLTVFQIFVGGVAAGAFVLWGISLLRFGTRRELKARRERKELSALSEKLDRVERDRRDDQPDQV